MTGEPLTTRFSLPPAQAAALTTYAEFIAGWREANVVGMRDPDQIEEVLFGDALALLDVPQLLARRSGRWLDLGAGAGIPGLPLALVFEELEITLLEANGKKCRFMCEAVERLELGERVRVVCARSERYAAVGAVGREAYGAVVARAVAPLSALVELAAPLIAVGGVLVASKTGAAAGEEIGPAAEVAARAGFSSAETLRLERSSLADAVAVVFEKTSPTPNELPRREGMATKRPFGARRSSATIEARAKGDA